MYKKIIFIVLFCSFCLVFNSCGGDDNSSSDQTNSGDNNSNEDNNSGSDYVPQNYSLIEEDNFDSFNSENWSKGLLHDSDPSIRMKWNKNTGGQNLLNDNYAGYLMDDNVYIKAVSGLSPGGPEHTVWGKIRKFVRQQYLVWSRF